MSPENLYANPETTTAAYITGNIDGKDSQIAYNATGKMVSLSFMIIWDIAIKPISGG